jgi:hypothetical protein
VAHEPYACWVDDEVFRLMHYRSCLRRFLRSSGVFCGNAGITQAQYELLLAVEAGTRRRSAPPTIGFAVKALSIRPSSIVELVDRSERDGLVVRSATPRMPEPFASVSPSKDTSYSLSSPTVTQRSGRV